MRKTCRILGYILGGLLLVTSIAVFINEYSKKNFATPIIIFICALIIIYLAYLTSRPTQDPLLLEENAKLRMQVIDLKRKVSPEFSQLEIIKNDLLSKKNDLSEKQKELCDIQEALTNLSLSKKKLESEVIELNNEATMQSFGLYTPMYSAMESPRIKQLLLKNREEQKEAIQNDTACDYYSEWTVNGSKREGEKMTRNNVKQILRSFNSECDSIIDKVRFNNYSAVSERIYKSANQLNKMNAVNKISITDKYIELKQSELRLVHEYALKIEEEKEAARQQRAEMREQKKAEAELKAARESLLKEEKHFSSAVSDLKRNIELCTDEATRERYKARLIELEETLDAIHEKQADIDYRQANQKAGYVYVISNVGSFGPDVYKIGVTRRLDPYERVQELSSASVPFKFDVHAMIFSPDAYGLETELHRIFDQGKLNKVNTRREFFHAKLEDIENVIKEKFSATFEMKYEADAEEWRISKKISEGELNESEIIKSDEDIANEDEGEIIA